MEKSDFATARKLLADKRESINGISHETIDLAIEALGKQMSKKPIANLTNVPVQIGQVRFRPGVKFYTCLTCGTLTTPRHQFCSECGQKLDWSENDG